MERSRAFRPGCVTRCSTTLATSVGCLGPQSLGTYTLVSDFEASKGLLVPMAADRLDCCPCKNTD